MRSKVAELLILGAIYIGSGIFIGYSLSEERQWNEYRGELDRMMEEHRKNFGNKEKAL